MFAKLLKYEWKATRKIQTILALAILGLGLVGSIILRLMIQADYDASVGLSVLGVISIGVIWLSLAGCVLASMLLLANRFYKHKFTDEGYLTFTLPVTSHQILWSSIVNFLLWEVIQFAALMGAGVLFLLIGIGPEMNGMDWADFSGEMSYMTQELASVTGPVWLNLLLIPASAVSNVILILAAITIGSTVARKHKILTSFGIYYGLNIVISTLSSVVSTSLVTVQIMNGETPSLWMVTVFSMGIYVALGIGGYLLSEYMIRENLNMS